MREDDAGGVEIAQLGLHLALEIAQDAARDVKEIAGALAEIVVVQFAHFARVGADDLLVGEVDVDEPAFDLLLDRLDQGAVFSSERIWASNMLASASPMEAASWLRIHLDLLAGFEERGLKPGDLTGTSSGRIRRLRMMCSSAKRKRTGAMAIPGETAVPLYLTSSCRR